MPYLINFPKANATLLVKATTFGELMHMRPQTVGGVMQEDHLKTNKIKLPFTDTMN